MKDICRIYGVNEEQARALDINRSIALRAGAGSGKTRVLTKRFVRCLLENPDITLDNIVAITFTKKAATEMKDRIRKELSAQLSRIDDLFERKRLSDIKLQLTNANIDTIHGFCSKLLRDNFDYLGLDPNFEILEEVDKNVILSRLADKVISAFLEKDENEKAIRTIAVLLSTGFFYGKLKQGILSVFQAMREKGIEPSGHAVSPITDEDIARGFEHLLQKMATGLVTSLGVEYRAYKEKENLVDFNDIEILSERLLRNGEILEGYYDRYTVIMVDEFQDVNPLQKRILNLLTFKNGKIPEGRLFIVGDHKQSIYGFRGSDYKVFEEACEEIEKYGRVEYLNNCYRSAGSIIGAVNGIFSQLLSPYERLENPNPQKSKGKAVEIITWDKEELKGKKAKTRWEAVKNLITSDDSKDELISALEAEYEDVASQGRKNYQGDIIAGVIQRLVAEGHQHRDIAILLRNRTSLSEIENSLTQKEIPYCVLGSIGFWDRQEIIDIISLYKLIFYPDDRLALFTALRSPIFGFSDDLLLSLSMFMRDVKGSRLDEQISAFSETVSNSEKWLVKRAADILAKLLPMDGILNSSELLSRILRTTAADEILTALPQGEKKLRNIEKLARIVEEFEAKGIYTAGELITYLEVLKESSGMSGEAFLDNEDSDAVKILTIHASKGLEFGAVLIPDMDKPLDSHVKRNKPLFYFDEEKGLIAMGLDENHKLNESSNPEYEKLFKYKLYRELEDSRRLFYVAATRGKEYLGMIGEKQEVGLEEELSSQNSFMKQLAWAMNRAGNIDEVISIDAEAMLLTGEYKS